MLGILRSIFVEYHRNQFCPKCGHKLCRRSGRCKNCGSIIYICCQFCRARIRAEEAACSACGATNEPKCNAACKGCEVLLRPTAEYCPNCGTSRGQLQVQTFHLGERVELEMIKLQSGQFLMGSAADSIYERPPHSVTIAKPLMIGRYPITQYQWKAIMNSNPSTHSGHSRYPVDSVSWLDCQRYCKKLSQRIQRVVRLPSESEWEYACRAGTETEFSFGAEIDNWSTWSRAQGRQPLPVDARSPNPWGLFDMHGNAAEWCQDVWHIDYWSAPSDGTSWDTGGEQDCRVIRGGSRDNHPTHCRSASRGKYPASGKSEFIGLRVVIEC